MKVKIFNELSYNSLEQKINNYIKGKNVIDIKYTLEGSWYSCLIMIMNMELNK